MHGKLVQGICHMINPALIEFEKVSIIRGNVTAIRDVSLKIGVGEHVAILGPNGCGKSTLVKAISKECNPVFDDGSWVRVFGRDDWNVFELRTMLGIVSSDLMERCTRMVSGREIVLSGFFSTIGLWGYNEITQDMLDRADRALSLLEISHLSDRFTDEMSTGEA